MKAKPSAKALYRPATWLALMPIFVSVVVSCRTRDSATDSPSPGPTRQLKTYQPVDWFELKYDPEEWGISSDVPETSWVIDWSRPVLTNRITGGCFVGANAPRDFGPGIVVRDTEVTIGNRDMRLVELLDEGTQRPIPARIYGHDIAVEYDADGDACLRAVAVILETYRDSLP